MILENGPEAFFDLWKRNDTKSRNIFRKAGFSLKDIPALCDICSFVERPVSVKNLQVFV